MNILKFLWRKAFKAKKRWISIFLILLSLIVFIIISRYCSRTDEQIINDFVDRTNIEDAVGQLFMVGLPSDHMNYMNSKEMDHILKDLNVGFIIANNYNYYFSPQNSVDKYLNSILDFNKNIQSGSLDSRIKIPVLIATDFEGPSYSSLNKGFLIPPSSLSLSASRDKVLISAMGLLAGNQLHNAGIDIILGPVLDTYNVKQGNRSTLQDRCFASSTNGVVSTASHYIKGLRESGVAVFAKHFPSHGSVETNPHQPIIPVYEGAPDTLSQEIEILSKLKNSLDGVMTSHIKLLYPENAEIATFSGEFIEKGLKKNGFDTQIIITDDMSSMGAIKKYLEDNKADNFSTLSIKAFDAGHDVLLFSHFASSNSKSKFTIKDLEMAKKHLSDHIKSSTKNKDKFKASLRKILKLKVLIAHRNGKKVEDVLGIGKPTRISTIADNSKDFKEQSESFLKELGRSDINTGEKLINETIKSATVIINKGVANYILPLNKKNSKILFCINEEFINSYSESFQPAFTKAKFVAIPQIKNDSRFQQTRQKIISLFDESDIIVYTVNDKSDSDLLSFLESHKNNFSAKVIIFSLCNPIIFDINVLRNATIVTSFTNHPASYPISIEVLLGNFSPHSARNIPISLGDNGKFYNVDKTEWIDPAAEALDSSPQIRRSDRFINECKSYIEEDNILIPKRIFVAIVLLFWMLTCWLIDRLLKGWWHERKPENLKESTTGEWVFCNLAKYHFVTTILFFLLPLLIVLIMADLQLITKISNIVSQIRLWFYK